MLAVRDDAASAAVLKHLVVASGWIGRIQWHIAKPSLERAEQGAYVGNALVQKERNRLVCRKVSLEQSVGTLIRESIELCVAELSMRTANGEAIRIALHLRLESLDDRVFRGRCGKGLRHGASIGELIGNATAAVIMSGQSGKCE